LRLTARRDKSRPFAEAAHPSTPDERALTAWGIARALVTMLPAPYNQETTAVALDDNATAYARPPDRIGQSNARPSRTAYVGLPLLIEHTTDTLPLYILAAAAIGRPVEMDASHSCTDKRTVATPTPVMATSVHARATCTADSSASVPR
jgi:hypothetical protein